MNSHGNNLVVESRGKAMKMGKNSRENSNYFENHGISLLLITNRALEVPIAVILLRELSVYVINYAS